MIEEKCCPYCGKTLQENAQFCPFCMRSLIDKQTVTPRKYRKKKWIILGSILAVLLIVTVVLLWWLNRPHVHSWEPIEESIYHEPQAYGELVISGYEKRVVYYCHYEPDKYIACFSMAGIIEHMEENHRNEADYEWVMDNLESLTIIKEEEMPTYGYLPYEVEGYYETVITGYRCTECGETKEEP